MILYAVLHEVVGLVHTDLKPENILFEEPGIITAEMPAARGQSRLLAALRGAFEMSPFSMIIFSSFPCSKPSNE